MRVPKPFMFKPAPLMPAPPRFSKVGVSVALGASWTVVIGPLPLVPDQEGAAAFQAPVKMHDGNARRPVRPRRHAVTRLENEAAQGSAPVI